MAVIPPDNRMLEADPGLLVVIGFGGCVGGVGSVVGVLGLTVVRVVFVVIIGGGGGCAVGVVTGGGGVGVIIPVESNIMLLQPGRPSGEQSRQVFESKHSF